MNIVGIINFIIVVLERVARHTDTKIDDQILDLLKVISQSTDLLDFLQQKISGSSSIPQGALTIDNIPDSAKLALGGGRIGMFIKFLPQIIELINLFRGTFGGTDTATN